MLDFNQREVVCNQVKPALSSEWHIQFVEKIPSPELILASCRSILAYTLSLLFPIPQQWEPTLAIKYHYQDRITTHTAYPQTHSPCFALGLT